MADTPHPAEKDLRIPAAPRHLIRAALNGASVPQTKNPKSQRST